MLKTCYKKADSIECFFDLLKESALKSYIRGGRISGVVFNERKYRLKTLGFTQERLQELEQLHKRKSDIGGLRKKSKEKIINHNR